jgi:hypothetical protein
MSNVLVTLGDKTDWLDPLRWGILARIAKKPGSRVANVMVGDSIVEERALQSLVNAGWALYRDDTVERPLAGPNVYLTEIGEEAVQSGRAWMRSIGTPKTGNRAAWRGASKGMKASSFDARELRRGTKSEKAEHGLPTSTARRIAMDHLTEDPRYYSKNRAVPLASVLAGTGVAPRRTRRFPPSESFTAFAMDTGGTARMAYQGPSLSTAREKATAMASQWQTPVTVVDQQWNEIKTYRPDEGVPATIRDRAGNRSSSPLTPDEYSLLDFMAKHGSGDLFNVGGEKIDLVRSGLIAKSDEVEGRAIHAITPIGRKMLKKARDHYGVSGDDLMVAIAEGRFVGGRVIARRSGQKNRASPDQGPKLDSLLGMARDAGRTGQYWNDWAMSDEAQDRIGDLTLSRKDQNAIEAAFAEGSREFKFSGGWRTVWTTAPADYDSFGTETIEEGGAEWHGKKLRRVIVDPGQFDYQTSRYASGLHGNWDEDPRVEEARWQTKREQDRAERAAQEATRQAGLEWLTTATDAELEDENVVFERGLRYQDARAEQKRRSEHAADATRAAEWTRCSAIVPEGSILFDRGVASSRSQYGTIPGKPPHVYYDVRVVRGWPDDADHANVVGEGKDTAGSLCFVADWITSGQMQIVSADDVPPRAVVQRIGHDHIKDIRRVDVEGRSVWVGRPTFGDTVVLDAKGHLVRAKKILEAVRTAS